MMDLVDYQTGGDFGLPVEYGGSHHAVDARARHGTPGFPDPSPGEQRFLDSHTRLARRHADGEGDWECLDCGYGVTSGGGGSRCPTCNSWNWGQRGWGCHRCGRFNACHHHRLRFPALRIATTGEIRHAEPHRRPGNVIGRGLKQAAVKRLRGS